MSRKKYYDYCDDEYEKYKSSCYDSHKISINCEKDKKKTGLLTEFVVDQPARKFETAGFRIPQSPNFVNLAQVRLTINNVTDRVFLTSTVGWEATSGSPDVLFSIVRRRLALGTEEEIFSTRDAGNTTSIDFVTTSFTFVDDTPILTEGQQLIEYILRATTRGVTADSAIAIGPVILTASEIEANSTNS